MRYQFAGFELDPEAYKLVRGDRELHLQPLVFDVLRYLVEHRERIVSKEELLEALWPDGTGNDAAVTWSISHARRALEQTRWQKSPIETMHGRGYRFVADVVLVETNSSAPPALYAPAARAPAGVPFEPRLPFVGRSEVMDRLHAQLIAAEQAAGNLTVLVGEAGMGKTRCASTLAAAAERRGFLVLSASSVEGVGAPVFRPWQQILRGLMQAHLDLRQPAGQLLAQLSAAGSGAGAGRTGAWPARPMQSIGAGNRVRLFDAVAQLLLEAAKLIPLLLLFDDLHWADAGTIELLSFAAPELAVGRLMVLATQREQGSDYNGRALANLALRGRHVSLPYLTRADVSRYIAEFTGRGEPPTEVSSAVLNATAGNPLFVQETVRSLVADNRADALQKLSPSAIRPSKLARDVLRNPLGTLTPQELALLSTASVLGESFELTLLMQVAELEIEPLLDRLEAARQRGFVIAEAPNRYRFRHALVRTILYDDVRAAERVAVHRRAAKLLSKAADAEQRRSEIAIHYYKSLPAGDPREVTRATLRAAGSAEHVSAFEDAAMFYQWALEAQALEAAVDPRERADVLVRCGRAQRLAGREDDARRTLEAAIELASRHDYGDLLVKAVGVLKPTHQLSMIPDPLVRAALEQALQAAPLGPHPQRIHALSKLACLPPTAFELEQSKQTSALALSLARQRSVQLFGSGRATLLEALRARLYSLSGPDDIDPLLAVCEEIAAIDRPRTDISWRAHIARFGALLQRGDLGAANAALDAAGHLGHELHMPEAVWHYQLQLVQNVLVQGRFDDARSGCRALRATGARIGLSYANGMINAVRGALEWEQRGAAVLREHVDSWDAEPKTQAVHSVRSYSVRLALEAGALESARRSWNRLSHADFADVPKESSYLLTLCNASLAAIMLADRPRAERLYELLSPYPEHNTPDMIYLSHGSVSRYLALLAEATGRHEQAAQHFETALAMNARLEYVPQLARTHFEYARWLRHREPDLSRSHARRAAELAEQVGMQWLQAAATPLA